MSIINQQNTYTNQWTNFFKVFFFPLMWTIFKVFIEFVTYCFCFMFWVFHQEAGGVLAPLPGTESTPSALEGKVLTLEPGSPDRQTSIGYLLADTMLVRDSVMEK